MIKAKVVEPPLPIEIEGEVGKMGFPTAREVIAAYEETGLSPMGCRMFVPGDSKGKTGMACAIGVHAMSLGMLEGNDVSGAYESLLGEKGQEALCDYMEGFDIGFMSREPESVEMEKFKDFAFSKDTITGFRVGEAVREYHYDRKGGV